MHTLQDLNYNLSYLGISKIVWVFWDKKCNAMPKTKPNYIYTNSISTKKIKKRHDSTVSLTIENLCSRSFERHVTKILQFYFCMLHTIVTNEVFILLMVGIVAYMIQSVSE